MKQFTMMEELLIGEKATLHDAMRKIDLNGCGIVFVTLTSGALAGVLTDGDIRRALLKRSALESSIVEAMTADCTFLPVSAKREEVLKVLMHNPSIKLLPLVNAERQPVDYASLRSLHRIPVASPDLSGNEMEYVTSCLRDGWISSQGPYVKRFEEDFAEYLGVEDAIATSSGTTALHLALEGLGIGAGDEVIVPNFTFAASINAILYCGATPVLVDVDRESWNIDVSLLENARTPRTKAVMVVHIYGHAANMDAVINFTRKHDLFLIEDAAESLGGIYDGKRLGSLGDTAAFSFFGNKLITTGEGGMVVAKSPAVTERIRMLRDHGMNPSRRYWHEVVGYNYRMTNLQAALGVAQLERIQEFVAKKRHIADRYQKRLAGVEGIVLQKSNAAADDVCWLFSVIVDSKAVGVGRDELMERLADSGIDTRPLFYPLHQMPPYQVLCGGQSFPVSDYLSDCGVSLPSAVNISDIEIDYVVDVIRRAIPARDATLAVK